MPIGQSAYDDALRAELSSQVTIKTPEGPRQISKSLAVRKAQIATAIQGNSVAQRDLAKEQQELEARDRKRAEEARQEALRRQSEQRENYRKISKYRAMLAKRWAEAEARGGEPDDPWPHPEDILLNPHEETFRIRGPVNEDDLPFFDYIRAERNAVFIKAYMDRSADEESICARERGMIALWVSFDVLLPLRWQLNCNPDDQLWHLPFMTAARVQNLLEEYSAQANRLRPKFQRPEHRKDAYRLANNVMKPLLKRHGYRSLAQFERAWDGAGGDPPWPHAIE